MVAEAAANPIPNADLRSILFIAFLPRLRNEPPQKRRAPDVGVYLTNLAGRNLGARRGQRGNSGSGAGGGRVSERAPGAGQNKSWGARPHAGSGAMLRMLDTPYAQKRETASRRSLRHPLKDRGADFHRGRDRSRWLDHMI